MTTTNVRLELTDTFGEWRDKFNQAIGDINTAIDIVPSPDTVAPTNHANTETKYGLGNATKYGHLKLSDAINSTSDVNDGIGATPKSVKTAYDKAVAAQNTANNALTKATTVFTGSTSGIVPSATSGDADFVLRGNGTWSNIGLGPISEKSQALGDVSGTHAINLSSGLFISATITGATTFSFTNIPIGSVVVVLQLTNGGSQTITWPTNIKWSGGTAPKFTASGIDIVILTTSNAGTTWYGNVNLKYA